MAENLEQSPPDLASESLSPSKQASRPPDVPVELILFAEKSKGGIQQYPVSEGVRAAVDYGLVRNPAAKMLLQSLVQLRETDLADARQERRSARDTVEQCKESLFNERTKNAVLNQRLRGDLKFKKLQNVMITLGGVMFGVGLEPLLTAFSAVYFAVALLGLILLTIGWFYPADPKEGDQ